MQEEIFGVSVRKEIVAEVIRWQLAKRRSGNHSTLTHSEVRGTTKKSKPQKEQGTRHGDKRAPIFRKGGIVFGPKPRSYEYSLNKKLRSLGLRMVLSDKLQHKQLTIIDSTDLQSHKTSQTRQLLDKAGLTNALFVSDTFSDQFSKSIRNIPHINQLPVAGLNAYDLLKHKTLVITKSGIDAINKRFH